MKQIYLLVFILTGWNASFAQYVSINENFNTTCVLGGNHYPNEWLEFNTIPPIDTLAWYCSPTHGRDGTPGMRCSGYYAGSYYFDTSWLFTPTIYVSSYTDSIYLRFDSKYEVGVQKTDLAIYVFTNPDSIIYLPVLCTLNSPHEVTLSLSPVIGNLDSLGWVTHQVNLTPYKFYGYPIRVAFRYISTTTAGGAWTLDNINTSPYGLEVPETTNNNTGIELAANLINNQLTIVYTAPQPGSYFLSIFDVAGKPILKQDITAGTGKQTLLLPDKPYKNGLYFVKMWNEQSMGNAKLVVTQH